MDVLIGALLAVLVIGVILYPFMKARTRPGAFRAPDGTGEYDWEDAPNTPGYGGQERIYEDIRTLRVEYELGTVEEYDYQEQLRAHRLQAAAVLRDQDQLEQEMDRSLEDEIAAAQRELRTSERGRVPCSSCGESLAPRGRVCPIAVQSAVPVVGPVS